MARSRSVMAVKEGLASGSALQQSSINCRQFGSHFSGIGGLNVLLNIPPALINCLVLSVMYISE
jgi:hypothetical protein